MRRYIDEESRALLEASHGEVWNQIQRLEQEIAQLKVGLEEDANIDGHSVDGQRGYAVKQFAQE